MAESKEMERLTNRIRNHIEVEDVNAVNHKLADLEDILEKHNISVEELDKMLSAEPTKALEYVKYLEQVYVDEYQDRYDEALNTIKQALMRLVKFDEAVKDVKEMPFEKILEIFKKDNMLDCVSKEYHRLKEQKSNAERCWDIIVKKCVGNDNLLLIQNSKNYEMYKAKSELAITHIVKVVLRKYDQLTKKEFNFIKERINRNE